MERKQSRVFITPLFEYTEWGNAKRFAEIIGDAIKYVPELDEWVYFAGGCWRDDRDGHVVRMIDRMLDHIQAEADDVEATATESVDRSWSADDQCEFVAETCKPVRAWRKASQSANNIKNTINLATKLPGMTIALTEFDKDEALIGCRNGVIDLESGRFITGDIADLLVKKQVNVEYCKDAECPKWESFLSWTQQGDQKMVSFLQRFIGSGLVGRLGKDKLAIFCGATGDNGKSTTVDTINNIFGDYGAVSSPEMLCEKSANNREYYLARLTGKRFVLMNEVKDGARLAGDIVKILVDSGETTARNPYGRVFEFQPRFTPILCTNPRPVVGTDEAVWRRIWLVPFDNRVSEEDKDRGLKDKLLEERQGILNWCIEGAKQYLRVGYQPPQKVLMATNSYKDDENTVKRFLRECCKVDEDHESRTARVREVYEVWMKSQGVSAIFGERRFTQELRKLGVRVEISTKGTNRDKSVVYGYRFKNAPSELRLASEEAFMEDRES